MTKPSLWGVYILVRGRGFVLKGQSDSKREASKQCTVLKRQGFSARLFPIDLERQYAD